MACPLIKCLQAATEKALRDIDEALAPAYQQRRKHRELQNQQPFFDVNALNMNQGRFVQSLPDELRPKAGQPTPPHLLRVYEDFSSIPRGIQQSVSSAPTAGGGANASSGPHYTATSAPSATTSSSSSSLSSSMAASREAHQSKQTVSSSSLLSSKVLNSSAVLEQASSLLALMEPQAVVSKPPGHLFLDESKARTAAQQIHVLLERAADMDDACVQLSAASFRKMLEVGRAEQTKTLSKETLEPIFHSCIALSAVIESCRDHTSGPLMKKLEELWAQDPDDAKLSRAFIYCCISRRLVSPKLVDETLARAMMSQKPLSGEVAGFIVQKTVLEECTIAPEDLKNTLSLMASSGLPQLTNLSDHVQPRLAVLKHADQIRNEALSFMKRATSTMENKNSGEVAEVAQSFLITMGSKPAELIEAVMRVMVEMATG